MSLDEYEENINKLDNDYKKEIQKLKKELKESKEYIESNKKDKNIVFKKISELTEENQKYIKEKQKIEQELDLKKQELNNKEHELANNKIIINDLEYQIKLLKDKENDQLKKIEAKNKIFKDLSTPTKIPQSVRKRDDKAKTFALEDFKKDSLPKYDEKSNRLENLENEYQKIYIPDLSKLLDIKKDPTKKGIEKLDFEEIKQESKEDKFYKYELNISDSRIKYLDKIIKENPKMSAKKIDIINQLKSLYTTRKDYFKIKIYNPESKLPVLKSLDDQIRDLEKEFRDQKGRRVFTSQKEFAKLLTFLAQLLTNNTAELTARSSKKLISDIEQLINNLYDNKQITKQVYNNLIKAITHK